MHQVKSPRESKFREIQEYIDFLYDKTNSEGVFEKIRFLIDTYDFASSLKTGSAQNITQKDVFLITYPDQISQPGRVPLATLADFCKTYLDGAISAIHVLPFYPSSSDDGFSVVDYRKVDPALGTWDNIDALGTDFRLMFDAVINHVSSQNAWFRCFLEDDPRYRDYFIVVDPQVDLSGVVRPRTLPLLTMVDTPSGEKSVWTTFSTDQIDLDYRHPEVLLEILETLLFYVDHGAQFIRLDAIAYLWKEIGTSCIHLPQTHTIIRLFRAVLDSVAPHVSIITETNVPHADNVSYFGDGTNEADLVYNFALPPLVLHTLRSGSAATLSNWAQELKLPSHEVTYYNFLASHDGIGLNPVRGILTDQEIQALVEATLTCGGLVSYKSNPDGTQSPYELNINYYDALSMDSPEGGDRHQIERFTAAHAIIFSIIGVPAIYFHSLFGSRGWPEGVKQTGQNRTINRQNFDLDTLEIELLDVESRRYQIYCSLRKMIIARAKTHAFDPYGRQIILDLGQEFFALLRVAQDSNENVLCIHNVSAVSRRISFDRIASKNWTSTQPTELISGNSYPIDPQKGISLEPYQVLWLTHA